MAAKLQTVYEEADETMYWLEIAVESGLLKPLDVATVAGEANEIVSMVVASLKTLRSA